MFATYTCMRAVESMSACVNGCMYMCVYVCICLFHTLRGGLCCSWVRRLRPLLFSWSCFHLAVLPDVLRAGELPLFPWLPWFWVAWVLGSFKVVLGLGLGLWLSVLVVPCGTWLLCILGRFGTFVALGPSFWIWAEVCKFWLLFCAWAWAWASPSPVFGAFLPRCLRSFFQTCSQNSSTLLRSGCSSKLRKSRYQIFCLEGESRSAALVRRSISPTRWDGMTCSVRRRRGWMKPCSTAWQWYTPVSACVRLRINKPRSVWLSLSSSLIWNRQLKHKFQKYMKHCCL